MKTLVVLFNLKDGVDPSEYEAWAKSTDLPIVRGLDSIDNFAVYSASGLLGSDEQSPYQYVEVITVSDFEGFGKDIASETMQKVASEFQEHADNPLFLITESID